jgi:hypothetical protein
MSSYRPNEPKFARRHERRNLDELAVMGSIFLCNHNHFSRNHRALAAFAMAAVVANAMACLSVSLPASEAMIDDSSPSEGESEALDDCDETSDAASATQSAQTSIAPETTTSAGMTVETSTNETSNVSNSSEATSQNSVPNESSEESQSDGEQTTDSSSTSTPTTSTTETTLPAVTMAQVVVATTSVGGRYAPRNAGVLWVERASGEYVDTLEIWAKIRRRHLVAWTATFSGDLGDAISGATAPQHVAHEVIWDLRDAMNEIVADGDYVLRGEFTEDNSEESSIGDGPTFALPFQLQRAKPIELHTDSVPGFAEIRLVLK